MRGRLLQVARRTDRLLARHTGRTEQEIRRDGERDKIFSPGEARDYGLIDEVITTRKAAHPATMVG
jgi:ATP-dependent Clp protease protease subunit